MTWQPLTRSTPYKDGKPVPEDPNTTQWSNDDYVVFRREIGSSDPDVKPMYHLSIRNQDRSTRHDWRDYQRIKNQLAGEEYEGLEIYPAESRKVDTANQYHLWCFPFTMEFGLGTERMVSNHDQTSTLEPGAVQRDNEPIDGPLTPADEMAGWLDKSRR